MKTIHLNTVRGLLAAHHLKKTILAPLCPIYFTRIFFTNSVVNIYEKTIVFLQININSTFVSGHWYTDGKRR